MCQKYASLHIFGTYCIIAAVINMLKRKITAMLEEWKKSKKQDCLLIRGVRQCGKTFIVRQFAKDNYKNFVELNFIEHPEFKLAFDAQLDVDTIIRGLSLQKRDIAFVPGETLILLDEIQECPAARTSLKFFAEDGRFDVIATGSLLGLGYKGIVSIPVGYETQLEMYPLDFTEFLWAMGVDDSIIPPLSFLTDGELMIPEAIHVSLLSLLREYMVVGGMPDVVNKYLETSDFSTVHSAQERILRDYQDDIAKYAGSADRIKAKACYLSIPRQLTKDNHKFQYSAVEKRGTARKFESSLDWLRAAGLVVCSNNLSAPFFPLNAYGKEDQFRIYLSDIGLFTSMFGYQMKGALLNDTLEGPAKGGIYESLVADIFYKNGHSLFYYKKDESSLEVEFLLEKDAHPLPIEVKAHRGPSKSLNELLNRTEIPLGIKLTSQNAGRVGKKLTLPLYMAVRL